MSFTDDDSRDARGAQLEAAGLNGFDFVLVTLPAGADPPAAQLEVHFLNANRLPALLASGDPPPTLLPVSGGSRIRAGEATGEVQVHELFVQVLGSVPVAAGGLTANEELTIEVGGDSVAVALAKGMSLAEAVAAVDAATGTAVRALALDGRLAIASAKTFALAVSSSRPDRGDGGGSGFDTPPAAPRPTSCSSPSARSATTRPTRCARAQPSRASIRCSARSASGSAPAASRRTATRHGPSRPRR